MKKRSRLLSVFLAVMMTTSLFAGFTVEAASPLKFETDAVEVFNQSFAGLESAADASDFDISGSGWAFTKYFMSARQSGQQAVLTKNNIDLSGCSGFEFSAKVCVVQNGFKVVMPGGYDLYWSNSSKNYPEIGISATAKFAVLRKDDTALAGVVFNAREDDTEWIIKYADGTWTVTAVQKKQTVELFSYVDNSNPTFNGKFGVQNQSTFPFTVFSMSLIKIPGAANVKQWKYETDFKESDTPEKYVADGLILPPAADSANPFATATTSKGSGTYFGANAKNQSVVYKPGDGKITGDYSFTFDFYTQLNSAVNIRFNYIDNNNYYELRRCKNADAMPNLEGINITSGLVLFKVANGEQRLLGQCQATIEKYKYYRYIVDVTEGDQKVNIKASLILSDSDPSYTNVTSKAEVAGEDNSPFADGGYISIYYGSMTTANIYGFSACSLVNEEDKRESSLTDWYSGNKPEYVARFYGNDGNIVNSVTRGAIYFEYPTARLGNYQVVATLYENHRMTDIKVIKPNELYSGKIKLFNVTDAANAKVRVYFIDSETSLNQLVDVYELN